jgi:hypothetical protein
VQVRELLALFEARHPVQVRELLALRVLEKALGLVEAIGEAQEPVAVRDLYGVRDLMAATPLLEELGEREGISNIRDLEAGALDAQDWLNLVELGSDPDLRPILSKLLHLLNLDGDGGPRYQLNLSELYYRKGRAMKFEAITARHEHNKWLESRYRSLKTAIAR